MNQRFLLVTALISASLVAIGLLAVDIALAHWIHASGYENAALFVVGLGSLDAVFGIRVWYWLASLVSVALGLAGLAIAQRSRLPHALPTALLCAGIVQAATIGTMMLGKSAFGRLRPQQLFESGDWSAIWFSSGGSFPSGHASFYFGLFLPLAASAPRTWQRIGLVMVPVYVALARLDMSRHFLSDVAASALVAAIWSLLVVAAIRRLRPAQ